MPETSDPNLEPIAVPRVWLQRLHDAAVKWGTHQEYDCPGDTPEPCGQWCDVCNQHISDDDHAQGHALRCPIEVIGRRLSE